MRCVPETFSAVSRCGKGREAVMLYYLFVIGIINLVLGYALAVYLGYGPPSLFAAWHAMDAYPKPRVAPCLVVAPSQTAVIPAEIEVAPIVVPRILPAPETPPPAAPVEEIAAPVPAEPPVSHVAMLDDRADEEELFAQPAFEAYDDDAVEAIRRDQPDTWETNAKYVETSIQNLNVSMMKNGIRAIELDNRLRSCRGHTDAETIQQCLAQLKEDCQTYLNELEEAAKRFQGRVGTSDKLSELGVANEMSNLGQAAQIETTLSNLENMDFRSDLEAANQRLMDELDHLRVARHAWRDDQESAFLRFAQFENSVNKIEKQLQSDPTTGLPNRIGLEMVLETWWQESRHQQQSLAAVLLDVDALSKLNRQHGALAGDSLLYQVGRRLRAAVAADDLVGRTAGGVFLSSCHRAAARRPARRPSCCGTRSHKSTSSRARKRCKSPFPPASPRSGRKSRTANRCSPGWPSRSRRQNNPATIVRSSTTARSRTRSSCRCRPSKPLKSHCRVPRVRVIHGMNPVLRKSKASFTG